MQLFLAVADASLRSAPVGPEKTRLFSGIAELATMFRLGRGVAACHHEAPRTSIPPCQSNRESKAVP
jgi:hypothetical protein